MGNQSACLKFAIIGHQDNWEKIRQYIDFARGNRGSLPLSLEKIREIYSYIPPRPVFDIHIHSSMGIDCHGFYIESFISPDELGPSHLRSNIHKVKDSCILASKMGADIVALGGFTSIFLESGGWQAKRIGDSCFTTGNTLTAALVCEGVEKACNGREMNIEECTLLIVGSTGDIGSACARYFSGKVKKILLCARRENPLKSQSKEIERIGQDAAYSTNINDLLPEADLMITVTSSLLTDADPALLPTHAIICDAGYPKNLNENFQRICQHRIFAGGMGVITQKFQFDPVIWESIYQFPIPYAVHGCVLEAIVLALEGIKQPYSVGRGNITVESMREISQWAKKHGIVLAPLFHQHGALHKLASVS